MSTPTVTKDEMQRLAFARYEYEQGVEQSRRPQPLSASSIFSFHDSVELFLQLAAEHFNESTRGLQFEQYWDRLEPHLTGHRLAEKETMRRLNKLRVNLKHDSTFPAPLSIEGFRGSVTSFFEVNTPLVFGIEFAEISMVSLVTCESARQSLDEALRLDKEGKRQDALPKVAVALKQVIDGYEERKRQRRYRSPFSFGASLTFVRSGNRDLDKVIESVKELQSAMKILALGLDYRRYARFQSLAPSVALTAGGTYYVSPPRIEELTADEYRFCFDFVIESALRLQEFDFES